MKAILKENIAYFVYVAVNIVMLFAFVNYTASVNR